MPVCNLDYIFELSDGPEAVVKENLVVAWTKEPSNGGFFMLKPEKGGQEELERIVHETRSKGAFDPIVGWGHKIRPNEHYTFYDEDENAIRRGTSTPPRAIRDCSTTGSNLSSAASPLWRAAIVWNNGTWTQATAMHCIWKKVLHQSPFFAHTCIPENNDEAKFALHPTYGGAFLRRPPYSDFVHFSGKYKPWEMREFTGIITHKHQAWSARNYWFHILRELNVKLKIGIDFKDWDTMTTSWKEAGRLKYDEWH